MTDSPKHGAGARRRILVAGAGLGGLAAAACLLRDGHDVAVFEQSPEIGEIGAGIQVSANAVHVLRHLGLEQAVDRVAVRPSSYEFRTFDTAELIQRFPLGEPHARAHGAPYYQLHRADLHALLAARVRELAPAAIHVDHAATGFDEQADGVTLHFDGRPSQRGDLLIGADGIKSAVRAQLLGASPAEYTGDLAWRVVARTAALPRLTLEQNITVWMGPGTHAVTYYLRGGELINFVGIVESAESAEESWTTRHAWEVLAADFDGWNDQVSMIIDAVDRDACFRWALHDRPSVDRWSSERVTLLGDAVHATLPYLAQGAAMAIEDSMVLARALRAESGLAAALDLYQRSRVERTARIVSESRANRALFHQSLDAVRAAFAKRDVGGERNAWLYGYNPVTVGLGKARGRT